MAAPLAWEGQQQSSLPIKMEIAYDILQPHRLSFNIAHIDKCLDLTDRGGALYVTSSGKDDGSLRSVNNALLTRLCVIALMSKRQGGFESQSVIFIDAGNCSDIYQCVNFARQYGLDIQKVLDSIIVSRPINIHQLGGLLINELDTTTILQRFGAKLVVISDILKMFVQDSQIDQDEARWLVKEIAKSLRNLSSQIMVVISVHECPPQYQSLLLSLFENQIDIAATRESSRLHVKVSSNLHNRHENGGSSKKRESSSFVITERELKIFPAR
ncbi:MAG: hypothetical protein M3264_12075 [Thermoproteota archaeon]|nr:hypothetical protein [Thermoproteota archaeon]